MLRQRTGSSADLLAVGLGNPGEKYERTRHNAGAWVISVLVSRHSERLKVDKGLRAAVAETRVGNLRLGLAVPLTFMNESGAAVAPLVRRYGIEQLERLVIVHDELDLPCGTVRIKRGGGTAGHNGLRSIHAYLDDLSFCRVRVGIGRPAGRQSGADFVLRSPGSEERKVLEVSSEIAADAVESILLNGVESAMNEFNGLQAQ